MDAAALVLLKLVGFVLRVQRQQHLYARKFVVMAKISKNTDVTMAILLMEMGVHHLAL